MLIHQGTACGFSDGASDGLRKISALSLTSYHWPTAFGLGVELLRPSKGNRSLVFDSLYQTGDYNPPLARVGTPTHS